MFILNPSHWLSPDVDDIPLDASAYSAWQQNLSCIRVVFGRRVRARTRVEKQLKIFLNYSCGENKLLLLLQTDNKMETSHECMLGYTVWTEVYHRQKHTGDVSNKKDTKSNGTKES